jgi:hypothetical protein
MRAFGLLLFVLAGCSGDKVVPGPGEEIIDLDDCAGDNDIEASLQIVYDLRDSMREMQLCGQLAQQLMDAGSSADQTLMGGDAGQPGAFSEDEGDFSVTNGGAQMVSGFRSGGSPLQASLFVLDSFFVDAEISMDGATAVIHFSERGPLAKLLPDGAGASSPYRFTTERQLEMATTLATMNAEHGLAVDDAIGTSRLTYEVDADESMSPTADGTIAWDLIQLTGDDDLGQTLLGKEWTIETGNHSTEGEVKVLVDDGPFPYQAKLFYTYGESEPGLLAECQTGLQKIF